MELIYKHGQQKLFVLGGSSALNPNVPLIELFDVGPFSMVLNSDAISNNLLINSLVALAMKRIPGVDAAIPILLDRRVEAADEQQIFNFAINSGMPQYQLGSLSGTWHDFHADQHFCVTHYDQSGNSNHSNQATATKQSEILWDSTTYGTEELTNNTFTNWTGDNPDNWPLAFTEDANNYVTEDANGARIVEDTGVRTAIYQDVFEAGKHYKISITIHSITSGTWNLQHYNAGTITNFFTSTQAGTFEIEYYAAVSGQIYLRAAADTTDFIVSEISVKQITGYQPYPYLKDFISPLRYLSIAHNATLSPANIGIYCHAAFDSADIRERIVDKTTSDGCLGWLIEKQLNNTLLFRIVSAGCINHDLGSTGTILTDGSFNNINMGYNGIIQAINLNGEYKSTPYNGGLQATTEDIGIGIRTNGEAFAMSGKWKTLIVYNTINIPNLFNEVW